jgi:hypothetical protein
MLRGRSTTVTRVGPEGPSYGSGIELHRVRVHVEEDVKVDSPTLNSNGKGDPAQLGKHSSSPSLLDGELGVQKIIDEWSGR